MVTMIMITDRHDNTTQRNDVCVFLCSVCSTNSPSLIGVLLMVLVYRTGGNNEENFNEITMGNLQKGSSRYGWMIYITVTHLCYSRC